MEYKKIVNPFFGHDADKSDRGYVVLSDKGLVFPIKSFLDDEGYMIKETLEVEGGFQIEYVSKSLADKLLK
ncbi:MAG: hypothetical protein AABX88_02165 [Nanoarchaeota archaeon]